MMNPMILGDSEGYLAMGMGMPMPTGMAPNMVMVPRCAMKGGEVPRRDEHRPVDDRRVHHAMQNLCAMMAGGVAPSAARMNRR